jgi:hypothetical protein
MPDSINRELLRDEASIIDSGYMLKSNPARAIKIFSSLLEKYEKLDTKYCVVYLY